LFTFSFTAHAQLAIMATSFQAYNGRHDPVMFLFATHANKSFVLKPLLLIFTLRTWSSTDHLARWRIGISIVNIFISVIFIVIRRIIIRRDRILLRTMS